MHDELTPAVQIGLAVFYVLVGIANLAFASHYRNRERNSTQSLLWTLIALIAFVHALPYFILPYFGLQGPSMPEGLKTFVNNVLGPVSYFILACVGFFAVIYWRKQLTHPISAWTALNVSLFAFGWSMTDTSFRAIITKPDNVPIVMLIYSVGFTTWFALRLAVLNDERIARGEPPEEKVRDDKVLVWPDLVYTELIAMVVCTFILVVWSVLLKAPLEQPASSSRIPNPSKAPWYFLGLQEMLVYFDPWMAGVVLPSFIIVGLMAMPYIDYNKKGNGYFTFNDRPFAIIMFLFGFIVLWVVLIVLGTFLRGPNWNFFGPYEHWDPHKTVPLNNINLSDIFWLYLMGEAPTVLPWYVREAPGIVLTIGYMALLPPLLAKTIMKPFFVKMGFFRFFMLVTLIQFMASLPIKMVLRWTINLKYIVFIPEYFFNI